MMKRIAICCATLLGVATAAAQGTEPTSIEDRPDGWRTGFTGNLNFNQTSLTNWSAGGENSIAGSAVVNLFGNLKKGKHLWSNSFDAAYGLVKAGGDSLKKADDRLELKSKYGYRTAKEWYLSVLLHTKSQFANGYNYVDGVRVQPDVSKFAAPAYVSLGAGMDWIPNEDFSLYLSPATAKWTIVADRDIADLGTYGNTPADTMADGTPIPGTGEQIRTEFGGSVRAEYKKDLAENVFFTTSLGLFTNYLDHPERVDVNWHALITAKVWKFIALSLTTELIYDYDVMLLDADVPEGEPFTTKRAVQFKEVFGVGISYTINNEKKEGTE